METVVNIWIVKGLLILTLMYLAYIDWRTFRLPDTVTIPLIILGICFNWVSDLRFDNPLTAGVGAFLGYASL